MNLAEPTTSLSSRANYNYCVNYTISPMVIQANRNKKREGKTSAGKPSPPYPVGYLIVVIIISFPYRTLQ